MAKTARRKQQTSKPEIGVFNEIVHRNEWVVQAIDLDGDGDVNTGRFEGPRAEELANHVAELLRKEAGDGATGEKVVSIAKRKRK
jgi:hypothetical protein